VIPTATAPSTRWAINDSFYDLWISHFCSLDNPTTDLSNNDNILREGKGLIDDMVKTNDQMFDCPSFGPPCGAHWWMEVCTFASIQAWQSHDPNRHYAYQILRTVIKQAKREWAEKVLTDATNSDKDLWVVAKWCKGRHSNVIPPLQTPHGVSRDHEDMSMSLHHCFFPPNPVEVDRVQESDPAPCPCQPLAHVTTTEVKLCLTDTANSSAPGPSGIGYKIVKWAFNACPDRFVRLFDVCVSHSVHPWKDANVVVIPKLGKADYSAPKAYCPISLLECCGKLLEKVVSKCILHKSLMHSLISPHQFGSRDYHCTMDAVLCVTHNAESAIKSGRVGTLILFDIQGFFNNIDGPWAVWMFELLGFHSSICTWVASFLAPRHTSLSFNGITLDPFDVTGGTPQGSPLSLILSAVFTSLMLDHFNSTWTDKSINLYVDDGAIFASGTTILLSIQSAVQGLEEVLHWLTNNGLCTDTEKSKVMIFHLHRVSLNLIGSRPSHIAYQDPFNGVTSIKVKNEIHYLRVFISHKLNWRPHITIMANRARSMVHSLSILGNSVRGIRFATWCRLFQAIVIPILTYGAPVWHPEHGQVLSLSRPLQVAQNDALRKMAGVFRTTPIDPLHSLLAIPPIVFTLRKLVRSYGDRVSSLPPSHLIQTILIVNHASSAWSPSQPPTTLRRILWDTPRACHFTIPLPTHSPVFTHVRLTPPPIYALTPSDHLTTHRRMSCLAAHTLSIYIVDICHADNLFHTAWLVYQKQTLVRSGLSTHGNHARSLLDVVLLGLTAADLDLFDYSLLYIYLPSRISYPYILCGHKHAHLEVSIPIIHHICDALIVSLALHIEFRWFSKSWSVARPVILTGSSLHPQQLAPPIPPHPALDRKAEMYAEWHSAYVTTPHDREYFQSCKPPDGNHPPPFVHGTLSRGNRKLFSAMIQLSTGHAFTSTYSNRFCPLSDNNTTCPCSSPNDRIQHSGKHVILRCPRFRDQCHRAFHGPSGPPSWPFIFSTFSGGSQLVKFLWLTHDLLYPLPPDPP
jgi:hypothetical protein